MEVYIMTDFNTMNKAELRAYIIKHPDNKSAFQAFVDRFTSDSESTIHSIPDSPEGRKEAERLIKQKLTQAKSN